jgi:hypothetical protein
VKRVMSRMTVLLALASMVVAFLPHPAGAEIADVDAIVFQGTTTVLTPVHIIGGGGNYTFTGTATGPSVNAPCEDDGDTDCTAGAVDAEAFILQPLSSSGTYTSIVCGTGTATGTATITEGQGSDSYNVSYSITFVAGIGLLLGSATEAGSAESGPVVGVVQISPAGIGPVPPIPPTGNEDCVTSFSVIGAAATTA